MPLDRAPDGTNLHTAEKRILFFQWRNMTTHKRAHFFFLAEWIIFHFLWESVILVTVHSGTHWIKIKLVDINRKSKQNQVQRTAVIGEKAIRLIDMYAWYVVSVCSCQAVCGFVLRQKLYSLWPANTAEGQCTTGGNGNTYVLLLDTVPGAGRR